MIPTDSAKEPASQEFRLIGGAWQPVVANFEQLKAVLELDEAWFAITGIDTVSLRADQKFLEYLDSDKNAKIRTDEIKDAIRFMADVLKDGSGFEKGSTELALDTLNTDSPAGAELLSSAKQILCNLGKADAASISLADINDEKQIKNCALCNGDGIITPDAVDANLAAIINLAIKHAGAETDCTGAAGINAARLDTFTGAVKALLAWYQEADTNPALLPFGENTRNIYNAFSQIKEAVDDYFLSSATLSFLTTDPDRLAKKDSTADVRTPAEVMELLKKLAIAAPSAEDTLDLNGAINPLWKDKIQKFAAFPEISALLQENKLSRQTWLDISVKLIPAGEWFKRCPESPALLAVSKEELEKAIAEDSINALKDLIAKDLATGSTLSKIDNLRKLLLYQAHMKEFLRNSLNLGALFTAGTPSWLQAGMMVMDGRHFALSVPVSNIAEHKRIVTTSNICVAYVEVSRGLPGALTKMQLAVAITSGNMRNLFPGKHGIFFDPAGNVYDAKITDFIRQPVSIGEALMSPFFKLGEFLGKQADKMLASKSNAAQQDLSKNIAAGKLPPPAPEQKSGMNGSMLLMGGGIGLAAIGSSVAFIVKSLQNVSFWSIIAILCGILLIFGGPMILTSLIKLYR
ncbi:MAG: hypothetical protein IKC05_01885, partial [Lentisphaeria bacterium]|nr:hypothetical protein [Lentisphaeria bacterium]